MIVIIGCILFLCYCIYKYNTWCKYNFSGLPYVSNVFAVINPNSPIQHIWKDVMKNQQFVCGHPSNIPNQNAETIFCFGGDGTIHKTIQYMSTKHKLLVLPCGTGNGIATSLNITNRSEVLIALSKPTIKIPLINVTQLNPEYHSCALMSVAWGSIADYDYYGENKLRFLGNLRSLILPFMIITKCKQYQGIVELTLLNKKIILSGNFTMVHIIKMPNIAHDVCLDSECNPQEHLLHVFIVREVSRLEMIDIFLNMNHLKNHKCVDMYICLSVKLFPENGNMAIDGEFIPTQPTEIDGNGKLIQMFSCK